MDYTVFWILGIIIGVLAIFYGLYYAKKKGYVKSEDLIFVGQLLGISMQLIDELDLKKEKEILKISSIIKDGVSFALSIYNESTDKQIIIDEACDYVESTCLSFNIELTENRRSIILGLVTMAINSNLQERI